MKGNLKRPDFRELMNPLLRTTAGILFFSWFFYRSVFAVILFIFPGILYFRKCVRKQREKKRTDRAVQGMSSCGCQFAQNRIRRGKCFLGEQRRYSSAFWRTIRNVW